MNISLINKLFLILSCFFLISACNSSKKVFDKIKTPKYSKPVIENIDNKKIIFNSSEVDKINFESKIFLSDIKNNSYYFNRVVIINNKIFTLSKDNNIKEFDLTTGKLNSEYPINILNIAEESIVSFSYLNNSFIIALKSGSILNIDLNGNLIWKFENKKILNTPLFIFDEQIIALYVDEINNISSKNGSLIWSENYNDLPVYQAKGGQLVNFLNLLFFILPNNKVGSIDLNFGTQHNFVFSEIPLISSINNTDDKIHVFKNYFTYLDEGKYLYTFDILSNEFTLFKKNIKSSSSNIFFNNSLITKVGNYLHAINIENGNSFWLIESNDILAKSTVVAARSVDQNIEIFLNNGDILIINNKELIEINNLDIKNIRSINFKKNNIIVNTDNNKTILF